MTVVARWGCARIVRHGGTDQLQLLRADLWLPARALDSFGSQEAHDAAIVWAQVRKTIPPS